MANPTRATIESEWANAIVILDEIRRFGNSGGYPAGNATNLIGLLNTLVISYAGDWIDEAENAVEAIRASAASMISPGAVAGIHRPFLRQYCKSVIGRGDLNNDADMLLELYEYFADNARYVQSRVFTYGTPTAAAGNIGNGQILRLTRDRRNFLIESGFVDSKRAICVADENTGTGRGQEVFEFRGQASARDELERSGSGLIATIAGLTIDDSLLSNPGFRSFGGTAGSDAPTSLESWTSTNLAGASLAYNVTNYGINQTSGETFRTAPSDGTAGNLQMKVSGRITQALTVRGTDLDQDAPYLLVVVWNRALGSAAGTLNLRLGNITTSITLSAQTGWNVSTVPNPLGQGAWYRNFAEAALDIQLEYIRTSGTLNVAEVLLVPGTLFDGYYYWLLPASVATYTPWRIDDEYTWPDIATGSAKNQTWLHRGFPGFYLPSSNGSSIGWADA